MRNPFGDLSALRIHASLSTSRLFAFPWMKSTQFSIHPWKYTSAMAFTNLLFQKLREFCALKSAKISRPLVILAFAFPPPAHELSSSGPKTTASEAAESWTTRCWWDILFLIFLTRLSFPETRSHARNHMDLLKDASPVEIQVDAEYFRAFLRRAPESWSDWSAGRAAGFSELLWGGGGGGGLTSLLLLLLLLGHTGRPPTD